MADVRSTTAEGDELAAAGSDSEDAEDNYPWPKPKNRTLDYVLRLLHRYMEKCASDFVDGDYTVDYNVVFEAALYGESIAECEADMVSGVSPQEVLKFDTQLAKILCEAMRAGVASEDVTTELFATVAETVARTLEVPLERVLGCVQSTKKD